MPKQTYIGITIGPLSKAFAKVRRTRELWAASYFFSDVMKNIILRICIPKHEPMLDKILFELISKRKSDFIVPCLDDERLWRQKSGIGFFPDRIIFKSNSKDDIEGIIHEVLTEFSLLIKDQSYDRAQESIRLFLRFFIVEESLEEHENPIANIAPQLDLLELQDNHVTNEFEHLIFNFFEDVNKGGKNSYLQKHYDSKDVNGTIRFESLVEISTRGLSQLSDYQKLVNTMSDQDAEKSEFMFIDALKILADKDFKTYHKYIAVVKVDGDSFGKYLQTKSVDELKIFHKNMLSWGFKTAELIKDYGGVPIYIGGDDCLFFAPVANELQQKNILNLCDEINASFSNSVGTEVSISFGVSISYYKFPLYEALEAAEHLIHKAKIEGKNRIALRVLKHSGNYYENVFDKSDELYTHNFKQLLNTIGNDDVLLSSVVFKLFSQQKIVESIAKDTVRFGNYIDNYFNEDIHKGDKNGFLEQIKTLIPIVFAKHKNAEEATKEVYSMLRLAKFLNGLDDDK